MKTIKLTTLLAIILLLTGTTSCKYEDGPNISLRTKKARLAGDWFIQKLIYSNGIETTLTESDGLLATFNKDGSGTLTEDDESVNMNWEFKDKKERVEIKFVLDGETITYDYKILRLTNKEFWALESDDGDNVEIHYQAR